MRSRSMTIWVMVLVLCVSSSQVMAWIQFNDGGTYDITTTINDDVWVDWESPGMGTTVNILDGAKIHYDYDLKGFEDSIINILGGKVGYLYAYDRSQVTVSGGSISPYLYAYDNSQVTVSGGSITDNLHARGSSEVTVSGGSIRESLRASYSSRVTISGGLIGGDLRLAHNAVVTIDGSNFAVDGMPFGYGELTSIFGGSSYSEPHRYLTGILASGDLLANDFRIGEFGKIVLVPEPASAVMLGLGSLFLVLRRRRRQRVFLS